MLVSEPLAVSQRMLARIIHENPVTAFGQRTRENSPPIYRWVIDEEYVQSAQRTAEASMTMRLLSTVRFTD